MKLTIGLVLTIVGTALAVLGIVMALMSIASLYQQGLNDPLATHSPDVDSKLVGASALRWVIAGVVGAVMSVIGSVLLGGGVLAWVKTKLSPTAEQPRVSRRGAVPARTRPPGWPPVGR
ncbi:MAG: hypothetical protein ACK5UW_08355 [bacterium]